MISLKDIFSQEVILEDDTAKLTPLKETDVALLDEIAYHPRIWELGMSDIKNKNDLAAYIQTALNEREQFSSYPFLIFDKKSGAVAGSTRFGSISIPNKRVEIGWTWLHPKFHGTGLNKHCKFLLLRYAFEELKVNRVEIKTDLLNMQSRTAILKIGATQEGIFRKHQVTSTGRERDSIFFSIINSDWADIRDRIFDGFS